MSSILAESNIEEVPLLCFHEPGYVVLPGPPLAPRERAAERELLSNVVLAGHLREAICMRIPLILLPKLLRVEQNMANPQANWEIT